MDIFASRPQRSLLTLAALALVLLGLSLTAVTWQNLSRQRQLIDQHMLFAARTIVHGVESNLVRAMPMLGRLPPEALKSRIEEFFREMVTSGEVVYLGVYDGEGRLVLSSSASGAPVGLEHPGDEDVILDPSALSDLHLTGEWYGTLPMGGRAILGYAARTRPGMDQYCPGPGQGRGQGQGQGRGRGRDSGRGPGRGLGPGAGAEIGQSPGLSLEPGATPGSPRDLTPEPGDGQAPGLYLLVGLSLDEHYAQFQGFKRNAILQTGFVLAAAAFIWMLLFAYLRRREQGSKLLRLESFHSRLLDAMPEGMLTVDADGTVSAANPAAKDILGQEVAGRNLSELPIHQALRECLLPGTGDCSWRQVELGGKSLELLAVPMEGETLILARDRTHLRTLERDLEQSRHLAAIGHLAAKVAHEIRNPLSSLRGFAQLFASKLKGKEPEESYARTMVQEADRLGRVVTDLLYLARPRNLESAPVDLAALAVDLERLLGFDLTRHKATLVVRFAVPEALADADGLKQGLINLILNALDALPETGGILTLSSEQEERGVAVTLADTGRGMEPEERERALEPYFTTKKGGSGLGLAIVHKIVRDHGGSLDIVSEPGRGTAVILHFPSGPTPHETASGEAVSHGSASGGSSSGQTPSGEDIPGETPRRQGEATR